MSDTPPPLLPSTIAAIEDAYRVFGRYQVSRPINVCACCCPEAEAQALETTPVRQMPARLLSEYTNSAHGYGAQDADTFRALLPRYFELIALNEYPSFIGSEVCLSRLGETHFREVWPASDVAAIDRCFAALLTDLVADVRTGENRHGPILIRPVDELLAMICLAGGDIDSVLAAFDAAPDPAGAIHIAELSKLIVETPGGLMFTSAFIEADPDYWQKRRVGDLPLISAAKIGKWMKRPELYMRLDAAAGMIMGPNHSRIITEGLERIMFW